MRPEHWRCGAERLCAPSVVLGDSPPTKICAEKWALNAVKTHAHMHRESCRLQALAFLYFPSAGCLPGVAFAVHAVWSFGIATFTSTCAHQHFSEAGGRWHSFHQKRA